MRWIRKDNGVNPQAPNPNHMKNITNALLSLLSQNIVKFTYRKADGTIRNAVGTRNLNLVRVVYGIVAPQPKTGRNNPTAYYDIEKEGWRSFIADNVLSIDGVAVENIKGVKGDRIVKVGSTEEVDIPIAEDADKGVAIPIGKGGMDRDFLIDGIGAIFGGKVATERDFYKAVNAERGNMPIGKVGTPTFEKGGIALPIEGSAMSIDDFAKLVAKYVVAEIADRLTK